MIRDHSFSEDHSWTQKRACWYAVFIVMVAIGVGTCGGGKVFGEVSSAVSLSRNQKKIKYLFPAENSFIEGYCLILMC